MSTHKQKNGLLLSEIIKEKDYKLQAYIDAFGYTDRTGWFRKLNNLASFGPVDIARLSYILELPSSELFDALYREVTGMQPEVVISKTVLQEIHSRTGLPVVRKKREN